MPVQFDGFPKIPRWSRDVVITEKIDGTNAQIYIVKADNPEGFPSADATAQVDDSLLFVGSRNRWITPDSDNYGFAGWVREHALPLRALGPGKHFGEWFGRGIQRRYGMTNRALALFNVGRWGGNQPRPECVEVVPVLYQGVLTSTVIDECVDELSLCGSRAVPGFKDPEGVVIYHTTLKTLAKKTCKDDSFRKGNVVSEIHEDFERHGIVHDAQSPEDCKGCARLRLQALNR